ncbi:hypothetical protein SPBR_03618 [Sporothrix brasiliensis 5110]|uniref:Six-hairpin glycosidase-like protein n=1 Tax=Sporothrix brasiliensis 5110 TaxID=1398154 RepID=A0A0C2J0N5_9PEZI|nr:uncharacterized protein SPBR_03618 [Sporothrix brasiliensis 5110]KIH94951.1 hypothetical protein SPBR_03618 [Sporothrix brasiliensis 5110]
MHFSAGLAAASLLLVAEAANPPKSTIPRRKIVQSFNVRRNASSKTTPLQVGNGNLAFGADVTGLQTFLPYNILSTWGWHNFSLPSTAAGSNTTAVPADFTGLDWETHGRLVNYDQPNQAEQAISDWLIQNPQRINLARIGLDFGQAAASKPVTETDLVNATQELDLWTGSIKSSFVYNGTAVEVETWVHPEEDMVGIAIRSDLLASGDLGLFMDFPYPDTNKFDAPFVGVYPNTPSTSTSGYDTFETVFDPWYGTIQRTIASEDGTNGTDYANGTSYYLQLQWNNYGQVSGPQPGTNRYLLTAANSTEILFVAAFSSAGDFVPMSYGGLTDEATDWWSDYWTTGAFVDLTASNSSEAKELQRRTILSQYLTVVNSASTNAPQGLVNNGWYGKFHLEMAFWHLVHFARWGHFDLLARSLPDMYTRFLPSSIDRAKKQGYKGARWGKMTDPTGRSAPGEINSLLIWQQPHPIYFAELHYRAFPNASTLDQWDAIVTATADFMASFAFLNTTTGVYDLGPPLYPVSETGNPNATINPAFELAYWRFGLDVAIRWKQRITNRTDAVPQAWIDVRDKLAPLPVENGTFTVYEGVPNMWTDPATTTDHPALAGIYGWLPPPSNTSGAPLNLTVVQNTADKIRQVWDLKASYGWDFPLLAMNSLRLGDVHQALAYLLDPNFAFDDAGYPIGGARVPTPYMPSSGALLQTVAMLAGGWDGSPGPHFPAEWNAKVEGFSVGL